MAPPGRRTAQLAALLAAAIGVTLALEWRPLARAWCLHELELDPGKLAGYAQALRGSVRGKALLAYVTTEKGGAAYLDHMVGNRPAGFELFPQSYLGAIPWPLEALAGRIVNLAAPPSRQAIVGEGGRMVIRETAGDHEPDEPGQRH